MCSVRPNGFSKIPLRASAQDTLCMYTHIHICLARAINQVHIHMHVQMNVRMWFGIHSKEQQKALLVGQIGKTIFSSLPFPPQKLSLLLFLLECVCAYMCTFICTCICICTWLVVCAMHRCICVYMHIVSCALPRRGIFEKPWVELKKHLFFSLTPTQKLQFLCFYWNVFVLTFALSSARAYVYAFD